YHSRTAILNNLEFDHADIFPDLAAIETQFHHLVRTIPRQGQIIVPAGSESLERVLARGCWTPVTHVGMNDGWHASIDSAGQATLWLAEREIGKLNWTLTGKHNVDNALAAMAAAAHVGVEPSAALQALSTFTG